MVSLRRIPLVVAISNCVAPSATPHDVFAIEIFDSRKEGSNKAEIGKRRFWRVRMRARSALSGCCSCVTLCAILSSEGWLW